MDNHYLGCPGVCGSSVGEAVTMDEPIKVETNIFDEEEIHHNCTVQVWRNSVTGEVSIGWWKEGEEPECM